MRDDDRQLFLDLLLAARDRVILTWSGRSVRDNSVRAPSVVVDELLDYLETRGTPNSALARDVLVLQHPLQPFSERYLHAAEDPRLFTFSQSTARAAIGRRAAIRSGESMDPPFAAAAIPPGAETAERIIALADLVDLWKHPSKFYCTRQLQLTLRDTENETNPDSERFMMNRLETGSLRSLMLREAMAGLPPREFERERRRLAAGGRIPPGALGAVWLQQLHHEVETVRREVPTGGQRTAEVTVQGDGWRIEGTLNGIFGEARHVARWKEFRADHRIETWVEHVIMCAARQQGAAVPGETVLHGSEEKKRQKNKVVERYFKPINEQVPEVPNAIVLLSAWVAIIPEALERPLPFFPGAGAAYIDTVMHNARMVDDLAYAQKGDLEDPLANAQIAYAKTSHPKSYFDRDAYSRLCFRGIPDPIQQYAADFERLARTLRGPLPWGSP